MGIRERKEREREARKKAILGAAKALFFEHGFHSATMDQIAEAAELSKGSLYLYYPSKEELYVTILVEGLEILHEEFQVAVEDMEGWEKKLRNIGSAYYNFYREYRDYFQILFLLQHGELASKVSDPLYQRCLEKGLSCLNILSQAIQEGMNEGEIASYNPMELAVLLWGSFSGVILLYEEEEHKRFLPSSLDSLLRTNIDLILAGLKNFTGPR